MKRAIRMGMVGGGQDSDIAQLHRDAVAGHKDMDIVCGVFSQSANKSRQRGRELSLSKDRVYDSYRQMFRRESKLPQAERMQVVAILTPNNMHYPIAMAALDHGFHVACAAPMTRTWEEAINLSRKVEATGNLFCLLDPIVALPMIQKARGILAKGEIGAVRRVAVEYPQGWLASRVETKGNRRAMWRTDARKAGAAGCVADLGGHCISLVESMTGLSVSEVCGDLATFVRNRRAPDDAALLFRFDGGARGMLWVSHIAINGQNSMTLRIFTEAGSLHWSLASPNVLTKYARNGKKQMLRDNAEKDKKKSPRAPASAAILSALTEVYSSFVADVRRSERKKGSGTSHGYMGVSEGLRQMAFLEAAGKTGSGSQKWVKVTGNPVAKRTARRATG